VVEIVVPLGDGLQAVERLPSNLKIAVSLVSHRFTQWESIEKRIRQIYKELTEI
jgi:hypothetical protein